MDERHKLDVMEVKCLGSMCEVTSIDRWRIEQVRSTVGVIENLSDRVDGNILKWFRHVERVSGKLLTKRMYESKVEGRRD